MSKNVAENPFEINFEIVHSKLQTVKVSKKVPLFIYPGPRSAPVSTYLMSLVPTQGTKSRLLHHLNGAGNGGKNINLRKLNSEKNFNDAHAINGEFFCNEEMLVLGPEYSVPDYAFLTVLTASILIIILS